ncbi:MAG: TIM-barrel domain-containing protein [Gemmatimonadota bacterium]
MRRSALHRIGLCSCLIWSALTAQRLDAQLVVAGQPVEWTVGWVGSPEHGLIRTQVEPIVGGTPQRLADDAFVLPQTWDGEPLRMRESGAARTLSRGVLVLTADPSELTVEVRNAGGDLIVSVAVDTATGELSFPIGDAPLMGLGQGGQPYDRRGAVDPMQTHTGPPWPMWYFGGRVAIPWLVSAEGWGIYFHAPHYELDLRGENGAARLGADADGPVPLDVFIAAPTKPAGLGGALAQILGPPSLPPLWSLGYQQSHRTLETTDLMMSVPRTLRERRLPADVLIYLGEGYVPTGWNTGHGSLEFSEEIFPDPEPLLDEMHELNFKVIAHVNRAPGRLLGTVRDPLPASGEGTQNSVSAYWARHVPVMEAGMDGFWPDEGDRVPAESKLARIRMYFEGPQLLEPGQRSYALFRSGFPGMQRYGGWLWSGDTWSNWDLLRKHVSMGLNTSLSGVTFWGSDTGGFWTTRELSGELYVRWFQFSAFNPMFRSHGRTWMLRLPYGWNRGETGPGEIDPERHELMKLPPDSVLSDPRVEPIARQYLNLRYRLMPYLYSLVWEAHEHGTPIMRPVWMHSPDDARARRSLNEYLWGRDILVAPVMEQGAATRTLYLPQGTWYDFWTSERIAGGREITRAVDLATMPLYVRAGAILPMGPLEQYTAEQPNDPLTITVFPGANGSFTMVEDDGTGTEPAALERMTLLFDWDDSARVLSVSLAGGSRMIAPLTRTLRVLLAGEEEARARSVTFSGPTIQVRL